MSGRLLTQKEAANLAGCSKDTIVRARRNGKFPHARLRDHCWTIPIDDLLVAGMYRLDNDETPEDQDSENADARGDFPSREPLAVELARALARIAALQDLVARQDEQLAFLRQLTVDTLGARGAGA